jgi:hypothetical protein
MSAVRGGVVVEDDRDGFPALILVAVGGCAMVAVGLTAATVVVSVNVYTSDELNGKEVFWLLLTLPAVGLVALAWGPWDCCDDPSVVRAPPRRRSEKCRGFCT